MTDIISSTVATVCGAVTQAAGQLHFEKLPGMVQEAFAKGPIEVGILARQASQGLQFAYSSAQSAISQALPAGVGLAGIVHGK